MFHTLYNVAIVVFQYFQYTLETFKCSDYIVKPE